MADSPLHMTQLTFDSRSLVRSARRQGLPPSSEDLGYLLHGQLSALFGDLAPKPFHIPGSPARRGAKIEVLGYGKADANTLREHAQTFAEPNAIHSLEHLSSKEMPNGWAAGRRLGFEVRACPVVRKSSATAHHRKGAEVDAFLAACERQEADGEKRGEKLDRRQVYSEWLAQQVDGAARLEGVDLARFRRARLFRRTQAQPRLQRSPERPDVTFRGQLEILDAEAFAALLERGIGRHRAFGFGMLLLRPPGQR